MDVRARILITKQRRCGAANEESTVQVDVQHRKPLIGLHLVEYRVTQDARVVHNNIEPAEIIHGGRHDPLGRFPVTTPYPC